MIKVAIIGTVGVPANYGGFETLVENILEKDVTSRLSYTVYCSGKVYKKKKAFYKEAKLKYIPLDANGGQSVIYDIFSLIHAAKNHDVVLILGVSGCCFLPIFRIFSKKRLIINIDGLEHRREKWGKWTRRFLKFSEKMAIKYGNVIVSDNKGIQDYVREEYGITSELIAYGGDHVLCDMTEGEKKKVLEKYSLVGQEYAFTVCRIEPENNVHVILEALASCGKTALFVGNWKKSEYGLKLLRQYAEFSNIKMLDPIYDVQILYVLRSCCNVYIHGHTAGGTNPSLVEAMHFGKPIFAYDVVYNRETTENKANYFSSVDTLQKLLLEPINKYSTNANCMFEIANRRYCWKVIAKQYESLY